MLLRPHRHCGHSVEQETLLVIHSSPQVCPETVSEPEPLDSPSHATRKCTVGSPCTDTAACNAYIYVHVGSLQLVVSCQADQIQGQSQVHIYRFVLSLPELLVIPCVPRIFRGPSAPRAPSVVSIVSCLYLMIRISILYGR